MDIVKGNIGNALHDVSPNHVVATADEIYDETLEQYQDVLNGELLKNTAFLTCGTGAATSAKVINDVPEFILSTDIRLLVKMTNSNTASNPTLNINGTGAKSIVYNGGAVSSTNVWSAGEVLDIYYNGDSYITSTWGGANFSTGEKVGDIGIDSTPTYNSGNLVTSGGVYNELALSGTYDISADHTGKIYVSLSEALQDVPQSRKKGGMEIKFILNNSNYAVDKEEGLTTAPSPGTFITSNPNINDGTYKADQLITYFTTLPTSTGAGNAVVYYKEISGDTITYTSWTITLQSSDNKYVQYRLMTTSFSTTVSNWQGIDDEIYPDSKNLITNSGAASLNKSRSVSNGLKSVAGIYCLSYASKAGYKYLLSISVNTNISSALIQLATAGDSSYVTQTIVSDIPLSVGNHTFEFTSQGEIYIRFYCDGTYTNLTSYEVFETIPSAFDSVYEKFTELEQADLEINGKILEIDTANILKNEEVTAFYQTLPSLVSGRTYIIKIIVNTNTASAKINLATHPDTPYITQTLVDSALVAGTYYYYFTSQGEGYIRFNFDNNYTNVTSFTLYETSNSAIASLHDKDTELEQADLEINGKIDDIENIIIETLEEKEVIPITIHTESGINGYYNSTNGNWYSDNSRRGTEKIGVVPGEKYFVTTHIGSSTVMGYLAQWNGDTYIGVASGFAGGSGNAVDREYIVPNNVTKIALCSYDTTNPLLKKAVYSQVPSFYNKEESDSKYVVRGENVYGVKWSISDINDLGTRCFGAVGLSATIGVGNTSGSSDFNNIYPWSEMKRCNIKTNSNGAKIVTFEGETGFSLDGSNGNVFVRIPKFKVQRYVDNGYEYLIISETKGFIHPAFIENGKELDEIFIGAFEGYIDSNTLKSVSGVIPSSNEHPSTFLTMATNNGKGYTLYDMRCVDAIWSLMAVEFGCRNSNRILGYGYSDFIQPVMEAPFIVTVEQTSTNTVTLGKPIDNTARVRILSNFEPGNNITICSENQQNIIAQRKITSVTCASTSDNIVVTFDGTPIDVTTDCFVGNAASDCNYCESIGSSYKLNYHTGRTSKGVPAGTSMSTLLANPCRYRWIENIVGNLWHYLPDVTFNDRQMYICDSIDDYEMAKITAPYRPVGEILPLQTSNGYKPDVNTQEHPNYWITSLMNDIFYKCDCFGNTFDTIHDGTITSTKGFGGYYYLVNSLVIIANGGGFDHAYRSNILTHRAWISLTTKWYLYGARLMYKNII